MSLTLADVPYVLFALFFLLVLAAIFLTSRERSKRRGREPRGTLVLPGAEPIEVLGEGELRQALNGLDAVVDGGSVRLSESPAHYIEATREGQLWSATLNSGRFWSSEQFNAKGTSDYTEREVRRRREAGPWGAFARATRPDQALNARQVEALFVAYLLGSKYPPELGGASHA